MKEAERGWAIGAGEDESVRFSNGRVIRCEERCGKKGRRGTEGRKVGWGDAKVSERTNRRAKGEDTSRLSNRVSHQAIHNMHKTNTGEHERGRGASASGSSREG